MGGTLDEGLCFRLAGFRACKFTFQNAQRESRLKQVYVL